MKFSLPVLLATFSLFLANSSTAQIIPLDWVVYYDGASENNGTDQTADMTIDAAGNSYVTGTSLGASGTFDIVTIKYDITGGEVWTAAYNGTANDNDGVSDLWLDAAGNVYVTGRSRGTGTFEDLVVIKYDNAGAQQWVGIYNGVANLQDEGKNVETDISGNVYVCGYTTLANSTTDWLVLKFNSAGAQQWAITYNGLNSGNDDAMDLVIDATGNPIVTGNANDISGTLGDIVTKKFSPVNGSTTWTATYNGVANDNDYGKLLTLDKNGNLFVAGRTFVAGYWFDYITIRYNPSTGAQMWATGYGYTDVNTNVKYEEINGLIADSLGNVYITGQSQGNGTSSAANDIATIKYNLSGVQQWVTRYTSTGNFDDRGLDITLDDTLNVYITGYKTISTTNKDMVTIKYNNSGVQQWLVTFNGLGGTIDDSKAIEVRDDGSVYISGSSDTNPTSVVNDDFTTIKYSPQNTGVGDLNGFPASTILYPNPASDHITLNVSSSAISSGTGLFLVITDASGRILQKGTAFQLETGHAFLELSLANLPAGFFLAEVRSETGQLITVSRFIKR